METARAPLVLPRGLIFLASLWLIGSWMLTIGVRTPVQPVSASYTPAVRMMLLAVVIGFMVGWPLLRLSQRASTHPIAQTMLDLIVLASLAQVVIWPLRLVTPWTVSRTAAIDAALMSWLAVAAAVVAIGTGSRQLTLRTACMCLCLLMCLLVPAIVALTPLNEASSAALFALSPLWTVWIMADGGGALLTPSEWKWIGGLAATAGLLWAILAAVRTWRSPTGADPA